MNIMLMSSGAKRLLTTASRSLYYHEQGDKEMLHKTLHNLPKQLNLSSTLRIMFKGDVRVERILALGFQTSIAAWDTLDDDRSAHIYQKLDKALTVKSIYLPPACQPCSSIYV
ncbi:hypothetical protein CBL_09218 [Carabus blaptoides fortunei]